MPLQKTLCYLLHDKHLTYSFTLHVSVVGLATAAVEQWKWWWPLAAHILTVIWWSYKWIPKWRGTSWLPVESASPSLVAVTMECLWPPKSGCGCRSLVAFRINAVDSPSALGSAVSGESSYELWPSYRKLLAPMTHLWTIMNNKKCRRETTRVAVINTSLYFVVKRQLQATYNENKRMKEN